MLGFTRGMSMLMVALAIVTLALPASAKSHASAQATVNGEKLYAAQPSDQGNPHQLISKIIRAETNQDVHMALECVQGTPAALSAFESHLQLAAAGEKLARLVVRRYGVNGWSYIENYLSNANIPVVPTLPDADAVQNDADKLHSAKISVLGDIARLKRDGSTVMQLVRYNKVWRLDLNSLDSSKTDQDYNLQTQQSKKLLIAVNRAKGMVGSRPKSKGRKRGGSPLQQVALTIVKVYRQAHGKR